jgi:hypothetical protein
MITTQINGKIFQIDGQGFLSPAEELTLEDWLHDMRAQDAANKQCRSVETISTHRKNLREKTQQHSAVGVLAYCLSHGIIRLADDDSIEKAAYSLGDRLRSIAIIKALKIEPLDLQAFRAQSRTKQRSRCVSLTSAQKAVAPVFAEEQEGCADYFDIPAFLRKKLHRKIEDAEFNEQQRMVSYARKAAQHLAALPKIEIESEAAA